MFSKQNKDFLVDFLLTHFQTESLKFWWNFNLQQDSHRTIHSKHLYLLPLSDLSRLPSNFQALFSLSTFCTAVFVSLYCSFLIKVLTHQVSAGRVVGTHYCVGLRWNYLRYPFQNGFLISIFTLQVVLHLAFNLTFPFQNSNKHFQTNFLFQFRKIE